MSKKSKTKQARGAFPKLTVQSRQGDLGVEIVSSIVNNELKWLFRKVHLEEDFGIDGHMDIVLEDGSVTGQSIAVQIKTGPSFMATKTNVGYVFYGENKHLNYYLNSQLPILVVICDPSRRKCYWELFNAESTEKTTGGWKMVIPFSQVLGQSSKEQLLNIVGPALDHTNELEKHWAFNNLLVSMGRILFAIDRTDIESGNTQHIGSFFERLLKNASVCEKLQGKVDVFISGYDSDTRELWEIPEVRNWFALAEPVLKYWFFFLTSNPPAAGINLLFVCLCGTETSQTIDSKGRRRIELDRTKLRQLMERHFISLNEITERLGMNVEQNKKISFDVMRAIAFEGTDIREIARRYNYQF
jgi:hypothetical protein